MSDSSQLGSPRPLLVASEVSEVTSIEFRLTPGMLADRIERIIRWRTAGRIRDLKVEINRAGVYLSGHCLTYYLKQLAQHAAMELAAGEQVINDIQVR
jgi:hypothetical protein